MELPKRLYLVRHDLSEANVAFQRESEGDSSLYTDEYRLTPNALSPLTHEGVEQAKRAGDWIRRYRRGVPFGRHMVTNYTRGMQTAAHLGLPNAEWFLEAALHERYWGPMNYMPKSERILHWPHYEQYRQRAPFHFTPAGGESFATKILQIFPFLDYLGRTYADESIILVGHYEVFQCFRIIIEHIAEPDFVARQHDLGLGKGTQSIALRPLYFSL